MTAAALTGCSVCMDMMLMMLMLPLGPSHDVDTVAPWVAPVQVHLTRVQRAAVHPITPREVLPCSMPEARLLRGLHHMGSTTEASAHCVSA